MRHPRRIRQDFSDAPLLSPLTSWLGVTGPIDAQRAHSIINAYSLAFFDRHLKGRPARLLDGPVRQYPEVLFESRRPQADALRVRVGSPWRALHSDP